MSVPASTSKIVQFGVFELDLQRAELRKQGVKVKLQEQPLKVLQLLLENSGQVVSREQIRTRIWPANTFVEFDQGLYSAMARLRDALGDSSESPRFIETVARRGYRFIAPVTIVADGPTPTVSSEMKTRTEANKALTARRFVVNLVAGLVGGALLLAVVLGFDIAGAREWLRSRTTPIRSIAVLPLENLSGDSGQEYLADGMTDELITNLAHLSDLRVISRTSAMHYRNTKKTLPEIGRELNVGAIVEGSVVRSGARVRITVQLVDATSDRHIWAKNYERNLGDVLGLQSEVAEAIAGEINLRLTASEKVRLGGPRALNPQAYQLYLQGRYLMDRASKENLQQAVDYYRRSIELDPGFARAWAGLGEAYSEQAGMGFLPEGEGWRKAREAIEQSLALDPSLAEAHAIMGEMQLFHDWNWQEANTSLQRAMALEPNDATVLQKKAWLDAILGRLEEALPLDRRAISLDPLSESARSEFEAHAYFAGRMEEAAAAIHRTLELDRQAGGEHYALALIELEKGHSTEALAQAQQEPNPVFRLQVLVLAYHALGQNGESDTALKELIDKVHIGGAFQIAEVYGFLGNTEQACKWLDSAYVQHDSGLPFVRVDRAFKKVERDPCYLALLKKMALAS
jgi:TolB-like protein/DNA-binding winged helix-turn-helix (wHTH) protein/Tfp pilus assembly protein PilF